MHRATKIKAACILEAEFAEGDRTVDPSFLAFHNDHISTNLSSIGLILGNDDFSVSNAIDKLKHVEQSRLDQVVVPDLKYEVLQKGRKRISR